ncbi:hypothetical protein Tco_0647596 [Tanacetum coccineum]
MMTAKKRVGPFLIPQLPVGHPVDHSSSDYFPPDDSARDSSSDSSSEASSEFHSDASSDTSSGHSLSDHSSPDLPSTSAGPSRKRRRSPTTSVPGTPAGRVILFAPTIPPSPDYKPTSPDYSPASDLESDPSEDPSSDYIPSLPTISPFLSSADDTRDSNRPDTPPSPTHDYFSLNDSARDSSSDSSLEAPRVKMPNTRSAASMTHEKVQELVTRQVAEEMEACEAAMNLEPLNENGDEQEGGSRGNRENGNGGNGGNGNRGNGGNGNGGNGGNRNERNGENGNGNRHGNHGMNNGGFMLVARECTFQDFLKCKPHIFSRTEGVVELTRWFEKIEIVFNISNCPSKYQVKYATCTLQDSALTWWNSHKRTIGVDAAYALN